MSRTAHVRGHRLQKVSAALVGAAAFIFAALSGAVHAHDIPDEIVLHSFVKPEADRLHVLVRIPSTMLLNLTLPKWGPGYLDLPRMGDKLEKAVQAFARDVVFYEDATELRPDSTAARISQASDTAFESFESARDLILGPSLPESTRVFWNQGYLDAYLRYPIRSDRSAFAIDMRMAPGLGDRLKMFVRLITPDGAIRAFEFHGGAGLVILDPRWYQAAWTFAKLGFEHILGGIDHLLFLLCLVLPFGLRHFRALIAVVTAFTIAHSITLIASATGVAPKGSWFPPLVETLIALSILYMALENIVLAFRRERRIDAGMLRRCLVVGAFGLVHGFGFSFILSQELQFAGDHFLLSLLSFNIGVEVGQIAFLAVTLPAISLLFRQKDTRRLGIAMVSALVAHTAWHWLSERWETLSTVARPLVADVDAGSVVLALLLIGVLASAVAYVAQAFRRIRPSSARLIGSPAHVERVESEA
jgi:HupE / UreJ protein